MLGPDILWVVCAIELLLNLTVVVRRIFEGMSAAVMLLGKIVFTVDTVGLIVSIGLSSNDRIMGARASRGINV